METKMPGKKWGRQFPKGVSGNPGGRPKGNPEVKEILKAASPEAARQLVEYIYHENPKIAMWAITEVLDRTEGKPIQAVNMEVSGNLDVRAQIRELLKERKEHADGQSGANEPDKP